MTVIVSYNVLSSYGQYYNDKKISLLELKKKIFYSWIGNILYNIYYKYIHTYILYVLCRIM